MAVCFDCINVDMPGIDADGVRRWIADVAAAHGRRVGNIAYVFADDEEVLRVNRQFLGHDYYTDIITFDNDEGDVINGDIIISIDMVAHNAAMLAQPYERELHRVIIHGILHLCGINDKGPGERAIMEAEEERALQLLCQTLPPRPASAAPGGFPAGDYAPPA